MDDSSPKRANEQLASSHLARGYGEGFVAPEVSSIASNSAVTVAATTSTDNQGQPFVMVNWHPHVIYNALIRVDQTTGSVETLLNAYDPTFPPYDDWDVVQGHHYVYELTVGSGSLRRVNVSSPVTPMPPPTMPDPGIIDGVLQPEQPIEISVIEAERLAKEEALKGLAATELNNVAQEKLGE